MNVDDYQVQALETIQFDPNDKTARSIVMLGLSGEVGGLSTEYKKNIRDGESYTIFRDKLTEEIGDIIWYISTLASIEGISLSEILDKNLKKTQGRWKDIQEDTQPGFEGEFYDDEFPENEKIPREFVAEFKEVEKDDGKKYASITVNGEDFGDPIRDNYYTDDYYRFHDIFHFSYATILGWSPIARGLMHKKRRSDRSTDEIEDGGRAKVIDEAISALVFEYARNHNFLDGVKTIDEQLLQTIKSLTRHLEVGSATLKEWEKAIIIGFDIWRKMRSKKCGRVVCSLLDKTMYFEQI